MIVDKFTADNTWQVRQVPASAFFFRLVQRNPFDANLLLVRFPEDTEATLVEAGRTYPIYKSARGMGAFDQFRRGSRLTLKPIEMSVRYPIADVPAQEIYMEFSERRDLKDFIKYEPSMFGEFTEHDIAAVDTLPINEPVDFNDKNIAFVPCRGMRSGVWFFKQDGTEVNPFVFSIAEYFNPYQGRAYDNGTSSLSHWYPVPCQVVPYSVDYGRAQACHFSLSGLGDYILIRAWRLLDGWDSQVDASVVRLSTAGGPQPADENPTEGSRFVLPVAANTDVVPAAIRNPGQFFRIAGKVENYGTNALTIRFRLRLIGNAGKHEAMDQHIEVSEVLPTTINPATSMTFSYTTQNWWECAYAYFDKTSALNWEEGRLVFNLCRS